MSSIDPDDIFDALATASQVLRGKSLDALAALAPGVNLSEYRVLVLLDDLGPQRLMDVAAALEVTSTTATRLADRLVAHGMVSRVRRSEDRREIYLKIGERGRRLVRAMATRRRRLVSSVLAEFSPADQAAAHRILTRFAQGPSQPGKSARTADTA